MSFEELEKKIIREEEIQFLRSKYLSNKEKILELLKENKIIKEQFYNLGICVNCLGQLGEERINGLKYQKYKICKNCYQVKTPIIIDFHNSELRQINE